MSKVDELREKYPKISKQHFANFVAGDITPTKKYLEYMCIIWTRKMNNLISVVSTKLVKSVLEFDSLLPYISNKDIYSAQYRVYSSLLSVIEDAKNAKADKEFDRQKHIDVLIENDDFLLLRPKTFQGSLKYGANTKWCTASRTQERHFISHTNRKLLVYLINKKLSIKNNYQKVAFLLSDSDSICGEIKIWNQVDSLCDSETLIINGWDFKTLNEIIINIRLFARKNEILGDARKAVERVLGFMRNLDLETFQNNINLLKNNNDSFIKDSKEIVDAFNRKIINYVDFLK